MFTYFSQLVVEMTTQSCSQWDPKPQGLVWGNNSSIQTLRRKLLTYPAGSLLESEPCQIPKFHYPHHSYLEATESNKIQIQWKATHHPKDSLSYFLAKNINLKHFQNWRCSFLREQSKDAICLYWGVGGVWLRHTWPIPNPHPEGEWKMMTRFSLFEAHSVLWTQVSVGTHFPPQQQTSLKGESSG